MKNFTSIKALDSDYYPYGMQMPKRHSGSEDYRYGFNGAEKNEEMEKGLDYDLGARMYNSKLGRMFSPDPREAEYPWQSTYAYYGNSPVSTVDVNGEGDGSVTYSHSLTASASYVFGSTQNKSHFNFALNLNLSVTSEMFQLDIGLNSNVKNGGLGFANTDRGKYRTFGALYAAGTLPLSSGEAKSMDINLWHAQSQGSIINKYKSSITYAQQMLFSTDKLNNGAVQRVGHFGFRAADFSLSTYEDHKVWKGDHGDRWLGTGGGNMQLMFPSGSYMRFGFDIMTGNVDNRNEALEHDYPVEGEKWGYANQSKFDLPGYEGYNQSLNAGRTFFGFYGNDGFMMQYSRIGKGQMF